LLAAIAEFERELIKERAGEGRKRAQAAGIKFGSKPKLSAYQRQEALSLGRSQHPPIGDCAIPSERQRQNIVAMAGWAAELQSGEAGDATYDSSDLTWVLTCLHQHAPSRIEIELGWAESEAERIVSANLDRITHELMSREELVSSAEILDIIEGRPPAYNDAWLAAQRVLAAG
jgi:hypothetical protein